MRDNTPYLENIWGANFAKGSAMCAEVQGRLPCLVRPWASGPDGSTARVNLVRQQVISDPGAHGCKQQGGRRPRQSEPPATHHAGGSASCVCFGGTYDPANA